MITLKQRRPRSLNVSQSPNNNQAQEPWPAPSLPQLICRASYRLQHKQQQANPISSQQQPHRDQSLLHAIDCLQGNPAAEFSHDSHHLPCLLTAHHQQQEVEAELEITDWTVETCPKLNAMWSDYYQNFARTPEDTELAPWVASLPHYVKRRLRGY